MALEQQIDGRLTDSKIFNPHFLQKFRQARTGKANPLFCTMDRQTETGLKQEKHRSGGPRLRGARHRIERGTTPGPANEPTKQLGETMEIDKQGRIEQTCEDFMHRLLE